MPLPDAVVAGVNKAGTTSLFHALATQEGVVPSRVKETHFFDPLKFGDDLPPLAEYEAMFPAAPAGATVLEATPEYFHGGTAVATAMAAVLPDVRVAVVLREPGARAFSWWRFAQSRMLVEPGRSFAEYLERCAHLGQEPESVRGLAGYRALSGGMYSEYLPAWQECFGDRLLVVFYEDLRADFDGTVRRVAEHFGAEITGPVENRQDNVTTDVRNRRLQRAALTVNEAGERVWRAAPGLKRVARDAYYRFNAKAAQERLGEADRAWLTEHFAADRARLRELLPGTALPAWLAEG